MKHMRQLLKLLQLNKKETHAKVLTREDLEKKAVEGAKRAVRDYRDVFGRLADDDRT